MLALFGRPQGVAVAATAAVAGADKQVQAHAAGLVQALQRSSGECLTLQRELVDGLQSATAVAQSLQQVGVGSGQASARRGRVSHSYLLCTCGELGLCTQVAQFCRGVAWIGDPDMCTHRIDWLPSQDVAAASSGSAAAMRTAAASSAQQASAAASALVEGQQAVAQALVAGAAADRDAVEQLLGSSQAVSSSCTGTPSIAFRERPACLLAL